MLNKQVLRIEKPLGCMLNKQVLRVKKPLDCMLNKQVLRVEKPTNQAFRTQVYELNTPFLLTTSVPSTTQTALKPLPSKGNTYPARHIPSFEELWSTVFYPPVSSHIPSFRRGLGRLFCQFLSFCFPIYALSPSKRRPFAS